MVLNYLPMMVSIYRPVVYKNDLFSPFSYFLILHISSLIGEYRMVFFWFNSQFYYIACELLVFVFKYIFY